MEKIVCWGILGNARIARQKVIPAILKATGSRLVALASLSSTTLGKTARRYAVERVYTRYQALIDDPLVDAVYIPLPNHLHLPWALKAFEAGKHVLCEKPLALNAAEAQQMAEAARSHGCLLMEAFMYRFQPRYQMIQRMIEAGNIGAPRLFRASICFQMDNPGDYRMHPEMGGGALWDVGCYGVNAARWMFGSEPLEGEGMAEYNAFGADMHFAGLLRFPAGGLAAVEASFSTAQQDTFTLVGSEGVLDLPEKILQPGLGKERFILRGLQNEPAQHLFAPGADQYQLMIEHFSRAVRGEQALLFDPLDSVMNMKTLDALAESARSGGRVSIQSVD